MSSSGSEEHGTEGSAALPPSAASPSQPPGRLPTPPQEGRQVKFWKPQLFGVPVLMLLPILAMSGAMGDHPRQARADNAQLSIEVTYPSRVLFRKRTSMKIEVQNRGAVPLASASVTFDPAWLEHFQEVEFVPQPSRPTVVELADLKPGERREIALELAPKGYGTLSGWVRADGPDAPGPQVMFDTFVLP